MIYEEMIKSIISEIKRTACLKIDESVINMLQEYIEACDEQVYEESDSLDEKGFFNTNLISFLVEITGKYRKYSLTELRRQQNLHIAGAAYAMLGRCYSKGLFGLERNEKIAVEYFNKSATCKNPMGTFELARCYETGRGTGVDLEQACQLYRASYKLGYIRGLHKYALILIRGNAFVEKNILDGFYILKQAVLLKERVYIAPYYDLGMLYKSGVCDVFNDGYYAYRIFKMGADKGCKFCQYKLGEEYEYGSVLERNMEEAFYWYRISADNKLSDAQFKVAEMLYGLKTASKGDIGRAIEQESICDSQVLFFGSSKLEKIYKLTELDMAVLRQRPLINFDAFYKPGFDRFKEGFRMAFGAASNGKKEAILMVAEALEKGYGTEKSILESLWWYRIAESLGCDNIREKIHLLEVKIGKKVF